MKPFYFFLIWTFGFFALISFDLFMEAFVFEWLQWNGSEKNDWFFVLWWGLVLIWFIWDKLYMTNSNAKNLVSP